MKKERSKVVVNFLQGMKEVDSFTEKEFNEIIKLFDAVSEQGLLTGDESTQADLLWMIRLGYMRGLEIGKKEGRKER